MILNWLINIWIIAGCLLGIVFCGLGIALVALIFKTIKDM